MQNLYEVLGNYNSIEEKREHLLELEKKYGDSLRVSKNEEDYYSFVKSGVGLYSVIKESILNYSEENAGKDFIIKMGDSHCNCDSYMIQFIRYFLDKYGFKIEIYHGNSKYMNGYYIKNIETMEDIKRLLNCFYLELQMVDYYTMSKEELWERHKKFYENNKEWMTSTKIESHHNKRG